MPLPATHRWGSRPRLLGRVLGGILGTLALLPWSDASWGAEVGAERDRGRSPWLQRAPSGGQAGGAPSPAECHSAAKAVLRRVQRCEADSLVSVEELATRFAPILWFSPDEPLMSAAGGPGSMTLPHPRSKRPPLAIPQPLPLGEPAPRPPVVYYQLSKVLGPGGQSRRDAPTLEAIDLMNTEDLTLKYFFYYDRDIGVNAHPHDLEAAEFDVSVLELGPRKTCRQLQLMRVKGLAHAVRWTANRLKFGAVRSGEDGPHDLDLCVPPDVAADLALRVEEGGDPCEPKHCNEPGAGSESRLCHIPLALPRDAAFPMALLVEEGKHASCPDRNGDGAYTPGYDVNHFFEEAWGVRDNFGSGLLMPRYTSDQTKRRDPRHRLFPTLPEDDPLRTYYECTAPASVLDSDLAWDAGTSYTLLPAREAYERYEALPEAARKGIAKNISDNAFGHQPSRARELLDLATAELSLALRDDEDLRLAVMNRIMPVPSTGGWLAMRSSITAGQPYAVHVEAYYTPSVSGWVDWYVGSIGLYQDPDIEGNFLRRFKPEARPELGVKFRFNLPLKLQILSQWLGLRLGIRAERLRDVVAADEGDRGVWGVRFVWEVGGAAW